MPPSLALTAALAFSLVLWVRESRRQPQLSAALWIPLLWLLILGSRSVSAWLAFENQASVDALLDGSPLDRAVFAGLMIAARGIVIRRRAVIAQVFSNHPWLLIFFAYGLLSLVWSDYPFVGFKRWFKSLGDPLMALVIISERQPAAALASVFRRCAFLLLPLSIVFIKYFPALGRAYDSWTGMAFNTGVTTNKNLLGYLLLVFGLFFASALIVRNDSDSRAQRRVETAIAITFLVMVAYLLWVADTKTPLIALAAGAGVVFASGSRIVRQNFGAITAITLIVVGVLQFLLNLDQAVLDAVGRDPTFTGRTDLWKAALSLTVNPWLGAGFESFWLGDRLSAMWDLYPVFRPNQAHNGYLQVYLNLGWVGVFLCTGVLAAWYQAMRDRLLVANGSYDARLLARFTVGYFLAFVLYNITEAVFQPLNFLFVVLVMVAFNARLREPALAAQHAVREATPAAGRCADLQSGGGWKPRPVLAMTDSSDRSTSVRRLHWTMDVHSHH
ncbi:MAG: O-antigen ligase family protein [Vicinamibacterales bacterium]